MQKNNLKGKREEFFPRMINEKELKTGVEIGVQCGLFSQHLLRESSIEHLFAVDTWDSTSGRENRIVEKPLNIYKEALKNLLPHKHRCSLIRMDSVNASTLFENEYFDFVYIDAGHTYEDVREDLNTWYHKLKKNGLIGIHDYHKRREWMGVIRAVNEFGNKHDYKINLTSERCTPSAWFLKRNKNEQI